MAAIGWQAQLDKASNEDDVAVVCNKFLSTWTVEELAELPSVCRPCDVIRVPGIAPYAMKLIAALDEANAASVASLHRMATFFTKAALRLVDVMETDARRPAHGRSSDSSPSAE